MVARLRNFLRFVHVRFCFHLRSARELHVLCGYLNLRSVGSACQWIAIRHRVRAELLDQDRQFSEQPLSVALSAPGPILHVLLPRHSQYGGMVRLIIFLEGLRRMEAGPILQTCDWAGQLRRRIWDVGGRSLHRHKCISTTLLPSRTGVRLQPTPAAASSGLLYYPDSSRPLRRPESSSVRTGSLPGCQFYGNGRLRDLVRSVALAITHRPSQPWPCLSCNLLCRVEQLDVTGNAQPRCAILPILEVATNTRHCSIGRDNSVEHYSARRSPPAADWWIRSHGKGKEAGAGALCRLDADCNPMGICEQEIDFPWALIPNSDDSGEDATPFLLRFLL